MNTNIRLDYSLKDPKDRKVLVEEIVKQTPPDQLTENYLEILTNYIVFAMDKEEKKKKEIITDNRMITINKRETSYQGLVDQFENGEDGLYNITIENDKNVLLTPKIAITPKDVETVPNMKELQEGIESLKKQIAAASGKKKFKLKKYLIEMYQEQYVLKNEFKGVSLNTPTGKNNTAKTLVYADLKEDITIDEESGLPKSSGVVSFFEPKHISALLCNYSALKEEADGRFTSDCWAMMLDLENAVDAALKDDYPLYYQLLIYKIDGKSNAEIQELLDQEFGIRHSVEYISALWRNKIPKLIAENEMKRYLEWYYTFVEKGKWKKCSRCGQIKLANNLYFSKNNTSKDKFYSICKDCRNKKNKEDRLKKLLEEEGE